MPNKIVRLAYLLQLKYNLQSMAAPVLEERLLTSAKQDILDTFRNHFSDSARGALSGNLKGSIFRHFAEAGDPSLINLTFKMDKLVSSLDTLSPEEMLVIINDMLSSLLKMKNDPKKQVRQNIRDAMRGHTEAVIKHHLSRYEDGIKRVFSLLQKAGSKLQKVVPNAQVQSGSISSQRGDLTRQEIITFIQRTPAFKDYGLNSLEVVEQILQDPELKSMMTTVINAVNRGSIPVDSVAINNEAAKIKNRLQQKEITNQSFFDNNAPLPAPEKVEDEE